jgi:imidazolonepropionase
MKADLLLDGIGDLATLADGRPPFRGERAGALGRRSAASLAVDRGRFVFVGPARRGRREVILRRGGRRIDLGGAAVVPGFVDAHTHLLFAGDRANELAAKARGASYAEIARAGGGLLATVRATRAATTASLTRDALARLAALARYGTTTVEVKSGYALDHDGELRLLRMIPRLARASGLRLVPTYLGAHAYPEEDRAHRRRYLEEIVGRTLPAVARERLARFCDVFCEPGYFDVPASERILRRAATLGLALKLHAEEFERSGGAALAARLRAGSADHLLCATAADRRALARATVTAVLLPVTPLAANASSRSPGRAMVDDGVPVALGSDLSPNSWVESMPLVLTHAVYSAHLTPAEAIVAATANAAHALGLAEEAGSIAVGRDADLAVFDVDAVEKIPYRIGLAPRLVLRRGRSVSSS